MDSKQSWGLSVDSTFTPEFGLTLHVYVNLKKVKHRGLPVITFHLEDEEFAKQETGDHDMMTITNQTAKAGDSYAIKIDGDIIFQGRCG